MNISIYLPKNSPKFPSSLSKTHYSLRLSTENIKTDIWCFKIYLFHKQVILMHCTEIHMTSRQGNHTCMLIFYLLLTRVPIFHWVLTISTFLQSTWQIHCFSLLWLPSEVDIINSLQTRELTSRENEQLSQGTWWTNGGVWIRTQVYQIVKLMLLYKSLQFWPHVKTSSIL